MDEDRRAGGQDEGAPIQLGVRHRNTRRVHANGNNATRSGVAAAHSGSPEERQVHAAGASPGRQLTGTYQGSQVSADQAKRRAKSEARNRARNNKRAYTATISGPYQNQRELQILVGGGTPTHEVHNTTVPWEHRGLLGQTRD